MASKLYNGTCQNCGNEYIGQGKQFCSVTCRQQYRNSPEHNPAKRPEVQAKMSASKKGLQTSLGRVLSDATKEKIRQSLVGKKSTPEQIEKRRNSYRKTIEQHGGATPALLEHLSTIHKSGKEHPNWKGGLTKQRDREFKTQQYREFRKAVLERDNYTCQWCGNRNGNGKAIKLEVHHIESYAEHPELRFDVNNGITLCLSCHNTTKRKHPRPRRKD